MRSFLILALSVLILASCDKEKTDKPNLVADSSVTDSTVQDAVAAPDSVTPAEDVTVSVDVTPVASEDAGVTD